MLLVGDDASLSFMSHTAATALTLGSALSAAGAQALAAGVAAKLKVAASTVSLAADAAAAGRHVLQSGGAAAATLQGACCGLVSIQPASLVLVVRAARRCAGSNPHRFALRPPDSCLPACRPMCSVLAFSRLISFRVRPPRCPSAVSGLPTTDSQIQLAGTLISSGATLTSILAQAGVSATIAAAPATTSVRAEVTLNLQNATQAALATAAQTAAVSGGAHTASMDAVFPGAAVLAEGAALVVKPPVAPSPPLPPSPPVVVVSAAAAQTCEVAAGASCFPGVQCIIPSIVEQAAGMTVRCGACPAGYTGALLPYFRVLARLSF